MKRRRLLYGLGLATVGSSATALTGATLSNTVSPAADFRVKVDAGLLVEAGAMFEERSIGLGETKSGVYKFSDPYSDSDGEPVFFTQDSDFAFEGTDSDFRGLIQDTKQDAAGADGERYAEFIVNDTEATNEALEFAATIPYTKGSYHVYFRDAIKVTNKTGGQTTIRFAFEDGGNLGYGEDVGDGEVLSKNQLKELIKIKKIGSSPVPSFEQTIPDNTLAGNGIRISPTPDGADPSPGMELEQGQTEHVAIGFEITSGSHPRSEGTGLQSALEAYTTNPANDETTLDLLDTLYIGAKPA
jgi:hypothetical protein